MVGRIESVGRGVMKIVNRKAHFDYELGERLEAGIVLTGAETKSARSGQVSMEGSYVRIMEGEAWIINLHIHPYKYANNEDYEATKTRKLLLGGKEILALQSKMKQARLMLVPTAMYTRGPRVKIEIALARGKKKYEKRETIKKRDLEREEGV